MFNCRDRRIYCWWKKQQGQEIIARQSQPILVIDSIALLLSRVSGKMFFFFRETKGVTNLLTETLWSV